MADHPDRDDAARAYFVEAGRVAWNNIAWGAMNAGIASAAERRLVIDALVGVATDFLPDDGRAVAPTGSFRDREIMRGRALRRHLALLAPAELARECLKALARALIDERETAEWRRLAAEDRSRAARELRARGRGRYAAALREAGQHCRRLRVPGKAAAEFLRQSPFAASDGTTIAGTAGAITAARPGERPESVSAAWFAKVYMRRPPKIFR